MRDGVDADPAPPRTLARAFRHRHGLWKSAAAHAWQEPSTTPAKANLGIPITLYTNSPSECSRVHEGIQHARFGLP